MKTYFLSIGNKHTPDYSRPVNTVCISVLIIVCTTVLGTEYSAEPCSAYSLDNPTMPNGREGALGGQFLTTSQGIWQTDPQLD